MEFIESYKKLKEELQVETTKLQELRVSYETLQKYISVGAINQIKDIVAVQKKKVDDLYERVSIERKELDTLKENYKNKITKLFNYYCILDTASHEYDCPIEPDEFMVAMNKFLYSNTIDNLQLRSDPPIAGVSKSTEAIEMLPGHSNNQDLMLAPFTTETHS